MNSNEILLVDKLAGVTSFGVVARVRRVLSQEQQSASLVDALLSRRMSNMTSFATPASSHLVTPEKEPDFMKEQQFASSADARFGHKKKRVKVGHTGTLDPFATGLLILLVGKGTKRSNEFLKLDKEYIATIRLGATSTTGDPEGEIKFFEDVKESDSEEVKKVVQSFRGKILQRVPNFSAVKINGERAYKLARKGVEVEMPTREVEIFEIEILDYKWPELKIRCHVSSGTYIRTLGEDIGEKLGVHGYLTELRRTKVGEYKVDDAIRLDDFMNRT